MNNENSLFGAPIGQRAQITEQLSRGRQGQGAPASTVAPDLFAAHMGAATGNGQIPGMAPGPAPGNARAQAMDTLNRMLQQSDGGDPLHSLRNSLSNMNLAGLTRLTQSDSVGALAESGLNTGENAANVPLSGSARFDIQRVERIRTTSQSKNPDEAALSGRTRRQHTSAAPGALSAQFESGADGIAAIGYDRTGGTSYGKYQIASAPGSMDDFVKFLKTEAPDLASRLEKAGPANTGGKKGAMPSVWKDIAAEQPERFERLQDAFISKSHFEPAMAAVSKQTGLQPDQLSDTMKEALWSTAVQHGPSAASRIFTRAIAKVGSLFTGESAGADSKSSAKLEPQAQEQVIREVYAIRATQFGSSTSRVQDAVQQRLGRERDLLLAQAEHNTIA